MTDEKFDGKSKPNTVVTQILEECLRIHTERHQQYGHFKPNLTKIAENATRLSLKGRTYTALEVATVMVAVKETRYKFQHEHGVDVHDSLIDWINYIAIMESLRYEEEKILKENKLNEHPQR